MMHSQIVNNSFASGASCSSMNNTLTTEQQDSTRNHALWNLLLV
jgi:hypothetical protein